MQAEQEALVNKEPVIEEPVIETPEVTATEEPTEPENPLTEEPEDELAEEKKRRERMYFEKREAAREAKRLQAEIEILKGTRTETHDEAVVREATAIASQQVAQQKFNAECNRISKALGTDLQPVLTAFSEAFPENGGIPLAILNTVIEAADGQEHKVLQYLSKNLDQAEELMTMTPAKQGAFVARITAKVTAPVITKMPAPIKPTAGALSATETVTKDFEKMSLKEKIDFYDNEELKKRQRPLFH